MAPVTALNFLLLGSALLVLDFESLRGFRPAQGLALLAGLSSLLALVGYAYGVDAIRSSGRGAHSIGILMQLDLQHAKKLYDPRELNRWRGWNRMFSGVFGG